MLVAFKHVESAAMTFIPIVFRLGCMGYAPKYHIIEEKIIENANTVPGAYTLRFLRNIKNLTAKSITKLGNSPLRYDFRVYRNVYARLGRRQALYNNNYVGRTKLSKKKLFSRNLFQCFMNENMS